MSIHADLSAARVLLEVAAQLAQRAANIASAVPVGETSKRTAENYERVGDEAHRIITEVVQ